MTRYTVVWLDDAQSQLAKLWIQAKNRGAISQAAALVDVELAVDPERNRLATFECL